MRRAAPTDLGATAQLVDLSWRAALRSKQLIGVGLIIAFAAGLSAVANASSNDPAAELFQGFELILLSGVVVPLIALLVGTSALATERESGTLAYLFVRPIRRTSVVVGKAIGALVVANVAVLLCVVVVFLACGAPGRGEVGGGLAALLLETTALTSLFVLFGALLPRSLYLGLAYIALFEGLVGNTVGARSGWSVTYHARNLLEEWSSSALRGIDDLPTSASSSISALLATALVALVAAAAWVETREFGVRERSKEE